jgi:hypothetical protein
VGFHDVASDDKTWSLIEPFNKSVVAVAFTPIFDFSIGRGPAERGGPPCKSGQLKKELGLEMSSARHAARLIIFEVMRCFFVGSTVQFRIGPGAIVARCMMRCGLPSADSGLQLDLEIA